MKMSNIFRLFSIGLSTLLITSACQNESKDTASDEKADDTVIDNTEREGVPLLSLPYVAVFDDVSEQLEAEENPDFDRSLLSLDTLTQALLASYPEINLEIDRVSNDTLYVQILDAQYLTQQMGSSGSQMYLLEATYAYTELPDINVVHFGFEEGDHAFPGMYTRESFQAAKQP